MDHLLNLSKAAKLAGVSRRTIQSRIQNQELETFEGQVRLSALLRVYPDVDPEGDAMLERVSRFQDSAMYKVNPDEITSERMLANQVQRLQRELMEAQAQLENYQTLIVNLKDRLVQMKENCHRQEKLMVSALISWMLTQMKERF
jgi:CDP-4-dehydro-6-deoxyglucose reductase